MPKIISCESFDVRFPTSTMLDGSDAMNADPDYSAAYLRLNTDSAISGDSLVFTIGRGNDVQIAAINILAQKVVGLDLNDAFTNIAQLPKNFRPIASCVGLVRIKVYFIWPPARF